MMRLLLALACALGCVLLAACAVEPAPQALPVDSADGLALLQKATDIQRAVRATSDARTATIQAATLAAAQTRAAVDGAATGTAQALQVRQTEMAANATANALGLQQSQTRQAATETSDARRAEATRTAEIAAANDRGTRMAEANQATSTAAAATSTLAAQAILVALDRTQATATAQAVSILQQQAQADATRSARWADFVQSALQALIALGGLAFLLIAIVATLRYLGDRSLRQKLIETRAGTVLLLPLEGGGYTAQLVTPAAPMLEPGDEFDGSQVKAVRNEAEDLLKVTTPRGESFITRTDPEAEAREARRRLAMRLLRESIRHYQRKGIDPQTVNRIPPAPDMGWSPDTWVKSVAVLKPHVVTKQGRGGGTFCAGEFPHLVALYTAVGERRVLLESGAPSPTANMAIA